MTEEKTSGAGYSIILASLRGGSQLSVAAAEMARMFSLDFRVAEQILRRAPIIIFKDMSEEDVQKGKGHFVALSRFGIDLRVTQNPPVNYPKVNWPSKPDFDAIFSVPAPEPPAPSTPSAREITVQLLCPCCGSTLRMRIDAVTVAPEAAVLAAAAPAGPPMAEPAPVHEPAAAALPAPQAEPPASAPAEEEAEAATVPETRGDELTPPPAPSEPSAPPPVPESTPGPEAEQAVVLAIAVAEVEQDMPWGDGLHHAVPVDDLQEDLDFSALGGAPLMDRILFGLHPDDGSGAPPRIQTSDTPSRTGEPSKSAGAEEDLAEVETQDASSGLDDIPDGAVDVVPIESAENREPGSSPEAAPESRPVKPLEPASESESGPDEISDSDGPPPIPSPLQPDEITVADEELAPWTGRARDYRGGTARLEKKDEDAQKPPLRKAIGDLEDLEDIPEIDLAGPDEMAMGKALVADVEEKSGKPGFKEGLEDMPEIRSGPGAAEPDQGGEEAPEGPPDQPGSPADSEPKKVKKIKRLIKPGDRPATVLKPAPAGPAKPAAPAPSPLPAKTVVKAKPAEPADDSKIVKPVAKPVLKPKTVIAPASAAKIRKPEEAPKKPAGEEEGAGEYSVFLSKIVSSERRRKAVEILSELKGISESEAESLTQKMIIPVVKGVGKDEAEKILDRFTQSKISGRIAKKK